MVFYWFSILERAFFSTGEPPAAFPYRTQAFEYRKPWLLCRFSILKRASSVLESPRRLSSIEKELFSIGNYGFCIGFLH